MNERMSRFWLAMAVGVALIAAAGCPGPKPTGTAKDTHALEEDEAPPPHGGALFATADHKIHAELVINQEKKTATVFLYDSRVKKTVPTEAATLTLTVKNGTPVQITLKADRQDADPEGQSSRFTAADEKFGGEMDTEKIEIGGEVKGKPYVFKPD